MTHKEFKFVSSTKSRRWPQWVGTALLFLTTASLSTAATLLLSDNFNAPDNANFDNSDQTGRRGGLLGADVQLRSARIQHGILDNQLNFLKPGTGSGRIRFQDAASLPSNVWWDFASGPGGAQILSDGGFRLEFDWTPANNTVDDWVSVNVGIAGIGAGEPGVRVNHAETDFGILFRNNGGTQYFDNGIATTGLSFDVSTVGQRHVALDYIFSSFADGSAVSVSAYVDGVNVLDSLEFDWDNNGGVLHIELGNLAAGTLIDNFAITTIPEPSAMAMLALGLALAGCRFRKV